jgi:hypothetical protein
MSQQADISGKFQGTVKYCDSRAFLEIQFIRQAVSEMNIFSVVNSLHGYSGAY